MSAKAIDQEDSVGRWLANVAEQLPQIDLDVEAAVGRIHKLNKHIERRMKDTLAEHGMNYGEWGILASLRLSGPPYRSSPGELSEKEGLSSGAMTNRLDQLEKAGLVRRL